MSGSRSSTPSTSDLDASPLTEVLADPAVRIVVHAGRQDVALLRRRFGTEVTNVFDTQVAAGFAGLGAQSSYDSLLTALLGLRLAKTASFTRWDTRPLSAEQVAYAREDVVHLLDLAEMLERRLAGAGAAAVGARGVRAGGAVQRRARPGDDPAAPAAGFAASAHAPPPSPASSCMAGGGRRAPGPAGPGRAERRHPGRARPAQPRLARRRSGGSAASEAGLGGRRGAELLEVIRRGSRAPCRRRPRRSPAAVAQAGRPAAGGARRGARPGPRARGRTWPTSCSRPGPSYRRS